MNFIATSYVGFVVFIIYLVAAALSIVRVFLGFKVNIEYLFYGFTALGWSILAIRAVIGLVFYGNSLNAPWYAALGIMCLAVSTIGSCIYAFQQHFENLIHGNFRRDNI